MPTRRFASAALQGAEPGLSRLAMALGGGGQQAYQQAQAAETANQSRLAQALSQIDTNTAHADTYAADAAQKRAETALIGQRQEQYPQMAAISSGTTLPMVQAFMDAIRTGQTATFNDVGPEPDGSNLRSPIPDATQSKIAQALMRFAPVAMNAGKDFGAGDWAKSLDVYRDQDLSQGVIDGTLNRNTVAGGQAAAAGKPQYHAGENGGVLSLFSGGLDTSNPMAQGNIALKGAQAKQAIAAAAEHNAKASAASAGSEADTGFSPSAIDNAAARYNVDGTLPPMGMGKTGSAGRAAILNRAAELASGTGGTDQRLNQLGTKTDQAAKRAAEIEFTRGKNANATRSLSVAVDHLNSLGELADALKNGNMQVINRAANYIGTQTGNPAPTNFEAARSIVADEIVKAIVGAGGGVADRAEAQRQLNAASTPAQLAGVIRTWEDLMAGQLHGLQHQYEAGTGKNDFQDRFVSERARAVLGRRGAKPMSTPAPGPGQPAAGNRRVEVQY